MTKLLLIVFALMSFSYSYAQRKTIVSDRIIYEIDTLQVLDDRIYALVNTSNGDIQIESMHCYILPDTITTTVLGTKRTFPCFSKYFRKQVNYVVSYLKVIPHGELIVFGKNDIIRVFQFEDGVSVSEEYRALENSRDTTQSWRPRYERDPYIAICGKPEHIIMLTREIEK